MTDSGVLVSVRVGGRPRTKGSMLPICTRDAKHTVYLDEDITGSKLWRKRVARALREAQLAEHGKFLQYDGPVEVRLVMFFPQTQAVAGGPIPTHATEWPTDIKIGDADKLARNILDTLSTPKKRSEMEGCSALILDDSQVVLLSVAKFWTAEGFEPGAQILVLKADNPLLQRTVQMGLAQGGAPAPADLPGTPCGCPYFRDGNFDEPEFCVCEHRSDKHEFGTGACAAAAPYSPEVDRG